MRAVTCSVESSTVVAMKTSLVTVKRVDMLPWWYPRQSIPACESAVYESVACRLERTANGRRQNAQPPLWALAAPFKG